MPRGSSTSASHSSTPPSTPNVKGSPSQRLPMNRTKWNAGKSTTRGRHIACHNGREAAKPRPCSRPSKDSGRQPARPHIFRRSEQVGLLWRSVIIEKHEGGEMKGNSDHCNRFCPAAPTIRHRGRKRRVARLHRRVRRMVRDRARCRPVYQRRRRTWAAKMRECSSQQGAQAMARRQPPGLVRHPGYAVTDNSDVERRRSNLRFVGFC